MIDLLSDEQVQEIIELRKQKLKLDSYFIVLTPLNHILKFWHDGGVGIITIDSGFFYRSYQPEIAKLYGTEYDNSSSCYIRNPKTRKHLYNLFINNPECLFFQDWKEIRQELRNRGLV